MCLDLRRTYTKFSDCGSDDPKSIRKKMTSFPMFRRCLFVSGSRDANVIPSMEEARERQREEEENKEKGG